MYVRAPQLLGADDFTGGRFYQWRPAEKNRALVFHNNRFVRHGGKVGAAGCARAQHCSNLGNAHGGHTGLVVEGVTEVLAVGKYLFLQRQKGTPGIHQIDAWQAVFLGDGLGAALFLDCQRVVGAAFYGSVVDENHAFLAGDSADTGDNASAGNVVVIHLVGCQLGQFQKGRAGVQNSIETIPRQ